MVVNPQRANGRIVATLFARFFCMFQFEADKDVIVKQSQVLEQALSTNPKTQQALQKRIRAAVMEARAEVVSSMTFKHGDPRGAARAVRSSVYKKILGANLNIYNSRKAQPVMSRREHCSQDKEAETECCADRVLLR